MLTTSTSGVTWTIVILFVYNGLQAILGSLPPTWTIIANAAVAALGIFVHSGQIAAGRAAKSGL